MTCKSRSLQKNLIFNYDFLIKIIQSKILKIITKAPFKILNDLLNEDLKALIIIEFPKLT